MKIKIEKRTGEKVAFDLKRIENAVYKAGLDAGVDDLNQAERIAVLIKSKIKKNSQEQPLVAPQLRHL